MRMCVRLYVYLLVKTSFIHIWARAQGSWDPPPGVWYPPPLVYSPPQSVGSHVQVQELALRLYFVWSETLFFDVVSGLRIISQKSHISHKWKQAVIHMN